MGIEKRDWKSDAAKSLRAAHGAGDPATIIQRLAEDLVAESELKRPAQNLKMLASFQGIVDIQECRMADAGRIVPTEQGLVIQVNEAHGLPKRNFSACHEIGHTLIPSFRTGASQRRVDPTTGQFDSDEEEEYLCDLAASELLLPTRHFVDEARTHPLRLETVSHLATEFEASMEATAIKLVRSGLGDIALIIWERAWKPTQVRCMVNPGLSDEQGVTLPPKKMRVRYAQCGGTMSQYFFPKSKSVEDGSLVHQAYETGGIVRGDQALFAGSKEHVFYTESQGFGNRGDEGDGIVMTLVYPTH